MSLPALRQAVKSAASEQGEVAAVTRHLRDHHGFSKPYAVNTQQGPDRRVLRVYVWRNTPMGHVALVAGPSIRGQAHVVEEVEGTVSPADVDLFIPAAGRSPALAAYKPGAAPVRANSHGRDVTRAMVAETTWGGGYSPHAYRPNPRALSPDFGAQLADARRRSTGGPSGGAGGGPSGPSGPVGPTHGAARAPVFAWLYDAAGRRYRVQYRVIATAKDGRGPVLASNLPGSFADTPAYPPAFQARSLSRTGEQAKIRQIADKMDPARYLLPHADPTFGAPVVWEGNGEAGTKPGVFYVLGGNSRTIAFLMADDAKIREYDAAAAELWPDIWPDEPAPRGYRYLVVRQAYPPSCPSLADARALNVACQMAFAQAQGLAGATQQSMAGRETPLGEAVSLVRGLGITGDIAEIVPTFNWSRGAVARDNVADFIADLDNRHFLESLRDRLGAERFNGFVGDPDNAAKLINSVLIGFLPRGILDRGFGTEKEEQALLAALPALVTLRIAERQGKIPAGFDLLPHLEDARAFADGIKGMTVAQARSSIQAMRAQGSLNLRTRDGDIVRSLGDRIGPLGILLGLAIKRAEGLRDPSVGMDAVLIPYVAAALASPDRFKVGNENVMFAALSKPTMPPSYPVEVLGLAVGRAIGGPEAEAIIPQTRASDRGETGGGAVVSVGSPGGGGGGMFGSRPAAPAPAAPVEPPPLAAPARPVATTAARAATMLPANTMKALLDYLWNGLEYAQGDQDSIDHMERLGLDERTARDILSAWYDGSPAWAGLSVAAQDDKARAAVLGVLGRHGYQIEAATAAPASAGLFGGRAAPVEPAPLAAPAAPAARGPVALPQAVVNDLLNRSDLAGKGGYLGLARYNDAATRAAAQAEIDALAAALDKARALAGPDGLTEPHQRLLDDAARAQKAMSTRLADAQASQDWAKGLDSAFDGLIRNMRADLGMTRNEAAARAVNSTYQDRATETYERLKREQRELNKRLAGDTMMADIKAPPIDLYTAATKEMAALVEDEIRRRFSAPAPAPALDLADELLRQAGIGPASAPPAPESVPLEPPPADESPLPSFVAERTGDLRDAWLALYRAARAFDRDAKDAPAQVVRTFGNLEHARNLFKMAREGHAGAFIPEQVEKAVKEVETARQDIADLASDYTEPDDGNRPRKLYEPNAAKAAWEDAKEAAVQAAAINLEPEARKTPLDVPTIGADLARLVLRLINDYVARWPDGPPTGGTRELASRRTWQNGRLVVDVDVLPVIREAIDGLPPNIDLRLSEVVPERLLVPLNDAVLDALRRAKLGPKTAHLQSTARVSARVLNRPNAGWPTPTPPPVASPAPAAPMSKQDRMAALLRDKVSRANPAARRNPLAPWEHDARPIYRPLLSAPYRRNGGPVLDERVKGAIRQILAAKYGKTGEAGEAVLAELLGAVSQLDASTPTDKLATVILGALADIVAIFDEDEGGEAGGEVVAFPGARLAPAPAATRLFYRPALNKQNTLLEYVDPQQNPIVEWATVPGAVEKTIQLSPSRWDQVARSLLTDRPGEFVGGVVGDLRDGGHLILTEIKADGRPTFYVDSQGYDYARYVLFAADVPREQVRDQIRRTMTADLKTLISDVSKVRDEQYQQAEARGYEIPRWTFPQDAAYGERLARIEQKQDGVYKVMRGHGKRAGPPSYHFEFDLEYGDKGVRLYKTLNAALKHANEHLAEDRDRKNRTGDTFTMTAADVRPYAPPTGGRLTPEQDRAWHAERDAEWANRHQRAAQLSPRTAAPAPRAAPPAPIEPAPLAAPAAAPTVAALQAVPHVSLFPSGADGRYAAQVMSGGSPLSQAQPGLEGFERLLGLFAPGAQYARQGGRGDYALVNLGDRFDVLGVDAARAFLAQQEAAWLDQSRRKWDAQADQDRRWQEVGKAQVPGIRFQEALSAGRLWEAVEAGSVPRSEWDRFVADLRASGKITAPPAPTRTVSDLPPEALEQIRSAMRAILAGLPA